MISVYMTFQGGIMKGIRTGFMFVLFCFIIVPYYAARQVIVIGSGLAGLSAAIEAYRAGAQVTIFEKEAKIGGNSLCASSGINGVGTPAQEHDNIQDAVPFFIDDTIKSGGGYSQKELVHVLVERSADAWRFLHEFGVDLSVVSKTGGHSRARTHCAQDKEEVVTIGTDIIRALVAFIEQHRDGITVLTRARVSAFLPDEHGEISGVIYETNGTKKEHKADAVVVATGGFCGHVTAGSLLAQYRPDLLTLSTTNGTCANGDGIYLAQTVGASLVDMEKIQIHPTGFVDPKNPLAVRKFLAPENLRAVGGILLTHEGRRFTNELGKRDDVTRDIFKYGFSYSNNAHNAPISVYMVLNERAAVIYQKRFIDFYVSRGLVHTVADAHELAAWIGADYETVAATLQNYTQARVTGIDQFGKKTFPVTFSVDEPLYVMAVTPCLHYCMGGVRFNEHAQVLGDQGTIKHLYAAGEVTGGLHGANRLCGNSLLECAVFGRIAGRNAALQAQ